MGVIRPPGLAQTSMLGHRGATPKSHGAPNTSVSASPGAIHVVGGQPAPSLLSPPFSSPSGPGSPPTLAGTGSCGPIAGWQAEAWVRERDRARMATEPRRLGTGLQPSGAPAGQVCRPSSRSEWRTRPGGTRLRVLAGTFTRCELSPWPALLRTMPCHVLGWAQGQTRNDDHSLQGPSPGAERDNVPGETGRQSPPGTPGGTGHSAGGSQGGSGAVLHRTVKASSLVTVMANTDQVLMTGKGPPTHFPG